MLAACGPVGLQNVQLSCMYMSVQAYGPYRYCGTNNPGQIRTGLSSVTVSFKSDSSLDPVFVIAPTLLTRWSVNLRGGHQRMSSKHQRTHDPPSKTWTLWSRKLQLDEG